MKLDLNPKRHYCLAYSGGVDSLALAIMLQDQGYDFTAVNVNHVGEKYEDECKIDDDYVHKIWEHLAIPLMVIDASVDKKYVKDKGMEAAMRRARYDALINHVFLTPGGTILTAHHANDQVETIIHQLFRGTGVSGLTGIDRGGWFKSTDKEHSVQIERPLLNVPKSTLEALVEKHGALEHVISDPSNKDMSTTRARIRANVIPALAETFGEDQMHSAVSKLVANMTDAESSLNTYCELLYKQARCWQESNECFKRTWFYSEFESLSSQEKKVLLRHVADKMDLPLTTNQINEMMKYFHLGTKSGQVKLGKAGYFTIEKESRTRHSRAFISLTCYHK